MSAPLLLFKRLYTSCGGVGVRFRSSLLSFWKEVACDLLAMHKRNLSQIWNIWRMMIYTNSTWPVTSGSQGTLCKTRNININTFSPSFCVFHGVFISGPLSHCVHFLWYPELFCVSVLCLFHFRWMVWVNLTVLLFLTVNLCNFYF